MNEGPEPEDVDVVIEPETPANPVTLRYGRRVMNVYTLNESELDSLSSTFNSVNFGFFGIAAGAALAVFITLAAGQLTAEARPLFGLAMVFILVLTAYFGLMALGDWRKSRTKVAELKAQRGTNEEEEPSGSARSYFGYTIGYTGATARSPLFLERRIY
jgi:hypothetical protein